MSWRERDYSREEAPGLMSAAGLPPAVLALCTMHVAAFFFVVAANADVGALSRMALAARPGVIGVFLHPIAIGALHGLSPGAITKLLITLGAAWILGGRVTRFGGPLLMLGLYGAGNLVAGLAFALLASVWPAGALLPLDLPLGAIAAWSLWSAAWLGGEYVTFGRWTVAVGRVAVYGLLTFAGVSIWGRGLGSSVWLIAAGAAALVGWFTPQNLPRLSRFLRPQRKVRRTPVHRVDRDVPISPKAEPAPEPDPLDIDPILAKISREGLASLTPEERKQLEAAREKLQHR